MRFIIGFGTGRCGSKSLATFLNQQPGVKFSHEGLPSMFPQWGDYFNYLNVLAKYGSKIVGNHAPAWVEYIDRLIVDIADLRIICLDREDPDAVVDSYWSYFQYKAPKSYDPFVNYPVFDFEVSRDAISRAVHWYLIRQEVLLEQYPQIIHFPTKHLNSELALIGLLEQLGIPKPWNLDMPWLNKREDMIDESE